MNIIHNIVIISTMSLALASSISLANPLSDAASIQKQSFDQEKRRLSIEESKEQTKKRINAVLQSLFFKYYEEVKKSRITLSNTLKDVEELNSARRQVGACCDILISSEYEDGMFLITADDDGLFSIKGYGLQSVKGLIQDKQYEQTGTLSSKCIYEVSISYKNFRKYSCSDFLSGKIDGKVINDMIKLLPVSMKNYNR